MIGRLTALIALASITLVSAALAHNGGEEPFKLIRRLHRVYEAMARGDAEARREHERLLAIIPASLANAERQVWNKPQNVRAVISYVLSGGEPKLLRDLLGSGLIPEQFKKLAEGALAYAEGREQHAAAQLLDIEARTLDPEISGAVALVQGALSAKTEPEKALVFFDQARLLAPGTVVEEAALRREIMLLAAAGRIEKLKLLLLRYIQQFPKSHYADTFWQQLANEIANSEALAAEFSELAELVGQLDEVKQQQFFLVLAEEGIIRKKIPLTGIAAGRAVALARAGSSEERRARVLRAAALIITDEFDRAVSELTAIPADELGHEESALRSAALSIARQIRLMPDHAMVSRDSPEDRIGSERIRQLSSIGQQTLERAKAVVAKVDAMIQEETK